MPDAVGLDRISRVIGYILTGGDFRENSPNLPQRIVVLGEANTANQGALDTNAKQIATAQDAGILYGYGSPIHAVLRILKPISGDGVGGIPVIVMPQAQAVGATSRILKIVPSGVATGNGTHRLKISGRDGVDGSYYDINIVTGDTTGTITDKIQDAVNAVLGAPVIATSYDYDVRLETKWKGLTANDLNVSVDTGDSALGLTYAVTQMQSGSGTPSIAPALAQFQNYWNTIVVNTYGLVSSILDALEAFNGKPSNTLPTGRYSGIVFKPFIAVSGSVLDDPSSLTDGRSSEVTIAVAPAPASKGFAFEAAANMTLLFSVISQNTPHLDVGGKSYPDMPTPDQIGSMSIYDNRDAIVKKGCSTVDLVAGAYQVQDFVTTYHPMGEVPPQFRYCRNLMLDFNVRYGYLLLEEINVRDKVIARDSDTVLVTNVIKPKTWKGIVDSYAEDLEQRGLIVDKKFTQASIRVNISTVNPDRLETFFRYKRSGVARIASTTAEAGFNFGTLN